jgi:hypothetical protein
MMDFGKVGMMTFPTASGKSLKKNMFQTTNQMGK